MRIAVTLEVVKGSMRSNAQTVQGRDPRNFDLLNFYRYVGAVWVALAHFSLYYPIPATLQHKLFERGEPLMGFFFTLSGFIITHVYDGKITSFAKYGNYLRRRLARIYPLFFATFAIFYVFGLCANKHSIMYATGAIIPNLLLIHAWNTTEMLSFDFPSWSLSAEMFVYLLFPAFLFVINRMGVFALAFPFILGLAVVATFSVFQLGECWDATYNWGCLRAAPSFVAGIIAYRLATRELAGVRLPAWFAHCMANASFLLILADAPGGVMVAYMAGLVFVMAAAEPQRTGIFSEPFARTLANASYGFYLLHAPVGMFLLLTLVRRLDLPPAATYALTPVALVITTALSIVSFRYFENPLRRYLISPIRRPSILVNIHTSNEQTVRDVR